MYLKKEIIISIFIITMSASNFYMPMIWLYGFLLDFLIPFLCDPGLQCKENTTDHEAIAWYLMGFTPGPKNLAMFETAWFQRVSVQLSRRRSSSLHYLLSGREWNQGNCYMSCIGTTHTHTMVFRRPHTNIWPVANLVFTPTKRDHLCVRKCTFSTCTAVQCALIVKILGDIKK